MIAQVPAAKQDACHNVFVADDTEVIPNQVELHDLIRDLGLTKSKAELTDIQVETVELIG